MNIKRENNNPVYFIKNGDKITKINKDKFLKKYNLHLVIRFHPEEFSKMPNNYLVHFNLQHTGHIKGRLYALVKINKSGFFTPEKEVPPILDLNNFFIVKCIEAKNNLSYEDLTSKDFKHSFRHIKNIKQLKKIILRRYSKSLPHLSKEEILSQGIAITKLKIVSNEKLKK